MKKFHPLVFGLLLAVSFLAFAAEKHWGYEDSPATVGPQGWGNLPGDKLCATGTSQTPIDLKSAPPQTIASPLPESLMFDYKPSTLELTNNGHSVQMNYEPGSDFSVGQKKYSLLQFHFHAKSEHSVDGQFFPMEAHLVHVDSNGKPAAVVAVFFKLGAHNSSLDPLFSNLPKKPGAKVDGISLFDATLLLPKNKSYFHYTGSLTTPPCTEGIQWYVLKNPVEVDSAQVQAFTSIPGFGQTSRPIQAVGDRAVIQTN